MQDLDSYQTAKDTAAETAGTVGAVAVGAASMDGTVAMSTPIVVREWRGGGRQRLRDKG